MKNYILLDRDKIKERVEELEQLKETSKNLQIVNYFDGLINSLKPLLETREENLKSLLQQAFEAGERNGREECLYDFGHIANFECEEPDFEDWYNKQQEQ